MDSETLRARVVAAAAAGPDAVVAVVVAVVGELAGRVASLEAETARLLAENAALRARLGTTSQNSSKPPSSDPPGARPHPKSLRTPSGRKPGGQAGHLGHSLRLVEMPDAVVVHAPGYCAACGESLAGVVPSRQERRQVIEALPIRPWVVEHQAETKACRRCGVQTSGQFPASVPAPVQYGPGVATLAVYLTQEQLLPLARTAEVLAEVFGCPVAEGTVERAVGQCHEQLAETEAGIKAAVTAAGVVHVDETGVSINGETAWLHVASTPRLTFFAVQEPRGRKAMDAIGVLPAVRGRVVHDGLPSYWQYEDCRHALCNAHHLRELTFVEEELGQAWAKDLKGVLIEGKAAVETARAAGQFVLPAAVRQALGHRYGAALAAGHAANPPPEATGKRGRPKRGKAGSLVARLEEHQAETLAFLDDFNVPFDNNQAERDLRMTKVHEKVSGGFRTTRGAERFCRIRGYVATLRKQGIPVFASLTQALTGTPPLPATH